MKPRRYEDFIKFADLAIAPVLQRQMTRRQMHLAPCLLLLLDYLHRLYEGALYEDAQLILSDRNLSESALHIFCFCHHAR